MAIFVTCLFCGKPGCITVAGLYTAVVAPIVTFFSWRTRRSHGKNVDSAECAGNDSRETSKRYIESCRKDFWQEVLQRELEYLIEHLEGCSDVLSVGCGPAIIEGGLAERGFNVTGLDVSQEALNCAPNQVRTVAARAEDMPFPESSFDAVIYVASLQFIEDYRQALAKAALALRPTGRIIVMLLNPKSAFFKQKLRAPDSYVRRIRHANMRDIEEAMSESFQVRAEYCMGVKRGNLFESRDPDHAVLYILRGTKLPIEGGKQKS